VILLVTLSSPGKIKAVGGKKGIKEITFFPAILQLQVSFSLKVL